MSPDKAFGEMETKRGSAKVESQMSYSALQSEQIFLVHGNNVSTSLTLKASTSCYSSLFRGVYTSPAGLINPLCLLKAYHTRRLTLLIKTKIVGVTTSTSIHEVPELHFNVPQILSTVARCSFWHIVQINIWCMRLH